MTELQKWLHKSAQRVDTPGMMLGREQPGEKAFSMVMKSVRRTRSIHNPAFKARVALAALRENKAMTELCR